MLLCYVKKNSIMDRWHGWHGKEVKSTVCMVKKLSPRSGCPYTEDNGYLLGQPFIFCGVQRFITVFTKAYHLTKCSENELHCLYELLTSVILVLSYAVTLCTMPQFVQSKVSDLQHPTTCNHTVRWLQIAMESQYGAMNVQHSLLNSITTYSPKFQNNKQETHTIIIQ